MAATIAGAVADLIETRLGGLVAYRETVGTNATLPYAVVLEGINLVPEPHGDGGASPAVREGLQVDLWQGLPEDYALPAQLFAALHGGLLAAAPTHVYGMRVLASTRLRDPDPKLVHHALTLEVRRALT